MEFQTGIYDMSFALVTIFILEMYYKKLFSQSLMLYIVGHYFQELHARPAQIMTCALLANPTVLGE